MRLAFLLMKRTESRSRARICSQSFPHNQGQRLSHQVCLEFLPAQPCFQPHSERTADVAHAGAQAGGVHATLPVETADRGGRHAAAGPQPGRRVPQGGHPCGLRGPNSACTLQPVSEARAGFDMFTCHSVPFPLSCSSDSANLCPARRLRHGAVQSTRPSIRVWGCQAQGVTSARRTCLRTTRHQSGDGAVRARRHPGPHAGPV